MPKCLRSYIHPHFRPSFRRWAATCALAQEAAAQQLPANPLYALWALWDAAPPKPVPQPLPEREWEVVEAVAEGGAEGPAGQEAEGGAPAQPAPEPEPQPTRQSVPMPAVSLALLWRGAVIVRCRRCPFGSASTAAVQEWLTVVGCSGWR